MTLRPLMIAAAMLTTTLAAGAAHAQDASVAFDFNLGAPSGQIMVALFDSQADYDGGRPVRVAMIAADALTARALFEGLAPGDYGMKAFHDVDGDGQMDVNPFGMPTEPFAFSNNAVGNMGPAGWDRASFRVDGATSQTIELR